MGTGAPCMVEKQVRPKEEEVDYPVARLCWPAEVSNRYAFLYPHHPVSQRAGARRIKGSAAHPASGGDLSKESGPPSRASRYSVTREDRHRQAKTRGRGLGAQ